MSPNGHKFVVRHSEHIYTLSEFRGMYVFTYTSLILIVEVNMFVNITVIVFVNKKMIS